MSNLSTDADAPDRTETPDQLSPVVMLLAVKKELETANPEKEPVTEKASFSLLICSTVTSMTLCDPADDVAVTLSNAPFRTVESCRKLVPSLEVDINEAASTASAIRLLIVSCPPSLEKMDPAVPELIATYETVIDIPLFEPELFVTAC
jgi:hypothetical protein